MAEEEIAMTVADIARILDVDPALVYREIKAKKLRGFKVGGLLRVMPEEFRRYQGYGLPAVVDLPEVDGEYEGRGWGEDA